MWRGVLLTTGLRCHPPAGSVPDRLRHRSWTSHVVEATLIEAEREQESFSAWVLQRMHGTWDPLRRCPAS